MGQIPKRLIEAVAEIQNLDEPTSDALGAAIVAHFGQCICQSVQIMGGHRVFVEMCEGHQFVTEDDRACTRVQHLLFARAMRDHWLRGEHGLSWVLQQAVDNA